MSKKETNEVDATLDSEQLAGVVGGAGLDLANLSGFAPRRGGVINPTDVTRAQFDVEGAGLLSGFGQPEVRASDQLSRVNPDWVSDSISVEVYCVGWSKDYDDPPPEPQPDDPDGGTGGGGGGGGAPGRLDTFELDSYDLDDVNLDGIDPFGRGGGLVRR
jgi:hypothetical protein